MDEIEKSLQEQKRRLLNDIMAHEQNFYIQNMSTEVQETMVKEGILIKLRKMIDDLDDAFPDVTFSYVWGLGGYNFNQEMNKVVGGYNRMDPAYDDDDDDDYFFRTDLSEAVIKIKYVWLQTCDLGCVHRTERFYIMNMPKLLDMLTFHSLQPPVKTIKQFIPDFFYDLSDIQEIKPAKPPMGEVRRKRGRPKLSASSKQP